MPIHLSLARADGRLLRRAGTGLAASAASLALAACLQVGYAVHLADREPQAVEIGVAPGDGSDLPPEARRTLAAKVAYLNRLLEADAVPWTAVLADLETALPEGAALTDLRPEGPRRLRLAGVAPSAAAVSAFIGRLETAPTLEEAVLLSQAEASTPDGQGLTFSVAVGMRSPR